MFVNVSKKPIPVKYPTHKQRPLKNLGGPDRSGSRPRCTRSSQKPLGFGTLFDAEGFKALHVLVWALGCWPKVFVDITTWVLRIGALGLRFKLWALLG